MQENVFLFPKKDVAFFFSRLLLREPSHTSLLVATRVRQNAGPKRCPRIVINSVLCSNEGANVEASYKKRKREKEKFLLSHMVFLAVIGC